MAFVPFRERFQELAERETRTVALSEDSGYGLPAGDYGFIEMFCDEVGCDCRRVFLSVFSTAARRCEAVINFGWEDDEFYTSWLKRIDPAAVKQLRGPSLALAMPQGVHAEAILAVARDVVLGDPAYVARMRRHYAMFRETVEPPRRGDTARKKVGRNDPCPCGSGRKYKKCCEGARQGPGFERPARSTEMRGAAPGNRLEASMVSAKELRFTDEVDYIVGRAMDRDSRLVRLGTLALFSTATGDAWVLDPEDLLALPLLLDGERTSAGIVEDEARFALEFTHDYRIDGDLFVVEERESGAVRGIAGYPLAELAAL